MCWNCSCATNDITLMLVHCGVIYICKCVITDLPLPPVSPSQQSDSSDSHSTPALPPLTPPLTRHQHQLQIQQQQQLQQRGGADKPLNSSSPSSSSAILSSVGPKPSQAESRMPGRHPHPPSGNNSKLKHKVCIYVLQRALFTASIMWSLYLY